MQPARWTFHGQALDRSSTLSLLAMEDDIEVARAIQRASSRNSHMEEMDTSLRRRQLPLSPPLTQHTPQAQRSAATDPFLSPPLTQHSCHSIQGQPSASRRSIAQQTRRQREREAQQPMPGPSKARPQSHADPAASRRSIAQRARRQREYEAQRSTPVPSFNHATPDVVQQLTPGPSQERLWHECEAQRPTPGPSMEQPPSHTGLSIPDPVSSRQSIAQCARRQREYETRHATPGPSSSRNVVRQEQPHPHNGALPPSGQQLGLLNCGEH